MSDLTGTILKEIRDEIRGQRQDHGEQLRGLRQEIRGMRREHGGILKGHGETLKEHGQRLDAMEAHAARNGTVLRQILGAVEYGNQQRDIRVEDIEERVTRIEEHLISV